MKEPKCTICKKTGHYKTFCFQAPRKPLATKKPLRASSKPLRSKAITNTCKENKPFRTAQIRSAGGSERSKLIKQADTAFSRYIRRKNANHEMARCVTCGAYKHWKEMQNGHYLSRKNIHTRWDEQNCHVQCSYCNEVLGGNLKAYKQFLISKYGEGIINELKQRSNKKTKVTLVQVKEIAKNYKEKAKKLE